MSNVDTWRQELETILLEFSKQVTMKPGQTIVIGCSTSEVAGQRIGTAGTEDAAKVIFDALTAFQKKNGIYLAFQCCEHLNRALVIEREAAIEQRLEIVTVTPIHQAGGAMATYAYRHFQDPVVVEFIKADAGIDIGDTFIGMHLKHVAVPVRCSVKQVGKAHVTVATTRPKLIGGMRAFYEQ
ncbi:TIGR01440 family protein [Priestia megaterium]|nr:TIGR01440 family protein [Priestia megaterium]